MTVASTVASDKAKLILESLTAGREFSVPTIDFSDPAFQFPSAVEMYKEVGKLTIEDLTSGQVDGNGIFDKLMSTVSKHVEHEFEENRITGAEYSTTYIAAMQSAMGYGVQFLLSRDASYWQAQQAQLQAIAARVELETAKVRHALMYIEANTAEANFGLTTMRLANEDVTYDSNLFRYTNLMPLEEGMLIKQNTGLEIQNNTGTYNLSNILPAEKLQLDATISRINAETALSSDELATIRPAQLAGLVADNTTKTYTNSNILPEQWALLQEQVSNAGIEGRTGEYNLANILPQQFTNLKEQETLIREQMEVQRAQTQDLRSDNLSVLGSVGKQKELYSQQIDSYKRDAELKAAKVFSEAWTVMKTVDEGLQPPAAFANANLQTILDTIKTNNNLG